MDPAHVVNLDYGGRGIASKTGICCLEGLAAQSPKVKNVARCELYDRNCLKSN